MARGRSTGRRSDYTWQGLTAGMAKFTLAAGAQSMTPIVVYGTAGTLVRCRGEILASIDGPADGDALGIACGLIMADDDAVGAGVASIPSPATDLDAEWIWHGFLLMQIQAGTGVGASLNVGAVVDRLKVDSKAMRRFKQNEQLVFAVQAVSLSGTPASDVAFGFRMLSAL